MHKTFKALSSLSPIKVFELEGLAPSAFCGMLLSDYGSDVIQVVRPDPPLNIPSELDILNRGKRSLLMNFKQKSHIEAFKHMIPKIDVLIDPLRPGVLEKLGLDPNDLLSINRRLIICRLSGYGQTGLFHAKAGHDLNYLADSGVLSTFGPKDQPPVFPNNLIADFAGGGLMGAFGILLCLLERERTGLGQIIDNSLTDSTLYLSSSILSMKRAGFWNEPRGSNIIDNGAPYYRVYQCNDGRFLCVGAIEEKFYKGFLEGLGFQQEKLKNMVKEQMNKEKWAECILLFQEIIKQKSSKQWEKIFEKKEACVSFALNYKDLAENKLHNERNNIIKDINYKPFDKDPLGNFAFQIAPSPKLSRNPIEIDIKIAKRGQHTLEILKELGLSPEQINSFSA